ncbi:MAG: thioesterase family protein [Peptococcaceae bacterium]|nr:thioesterase family protein [Peptococcaceae bacterium]
MSFNLNPGLVGHHVLSVTHAVTASEIGSGGLEVFATPAMLALVEKTAFLLVEEYLPDGFSSVGTKVSLDHLAATPIGMDVTAKVELRAVEGRKLSFAFELNDAQELVGQGTHERFIIETARFMTKVQNKLS